MMKCLIENSRWLGIVASAFMAATMVGCAGNSGGGSNPTTAIYTMTNAIGGNQVAAWRVKPNGDLAAIGQYSTNGLGVGPNEVPLSGPVDGSDPLASQGSVSLSADKRFLYVVNAGSNTVSSFKVQNNGSLQFLNVQPTGGTSPVSVAADANHAYVVNVNNPGVTAPTITGYTVRADGGLTVVAGSTRDLSNIGARPSQVLLSSDGTLAIVPERGTDSINVFPVAPDGTLSAPVVTTSAGAGPFGAMIDGNVLIVSELGAASPGGSSTSSYTINSDGTLSVISGAVANGETASCWVTLIPGGTHAYVTNTGSANVSNYTRSGGTLSAGPPSTSVNDATSQPIDAGITSDGTHFYQLLGARGTIAVFDVNAQGDLTYREVQATGILPTLGAQGLAVR